MAQLADLLATAERPVAIVGGAGWDGIAAQDFAAWADRTGVPVAAAFRRQDAIPNACPAYAGNLAMARIRSSSRGSRPPTCCWSWARDWVRRRPMAMH